VAVFRFEVDEECRVGKKVLFALPRTGVADGIQVDNFGKVWTAEGEGIVVRDSTGRELGVFNSEVLADEESYPINMFSLAGKELVVLAGDRPHVLSLGQNVSTPARTVVQRSFTCL
jgi:gluconolactonase